MDTDAEMNSQASLEKSEDASSSDSRDVFSDLHNVRSAIQMEDERSRQECKCGWDYATGHGTQRAHNTQCPVHDTKRVVTSVEPSIIKA